MVVPPSCQYLLWKCGRERSINPPASASCHTLHAPGLTACLEYRATIEHAPAIVATIWCSELCDESSDMLTPAENRIIGNPHLVNGFEILREPQW